MDNFSYLSVLISIVLGLGLTNLLMGLARVVQLRGRVRIYWPTLAWTFTLLLAHVQTWWTMFTLRQIDTWTFPLFALVLLQPVFLFFLSALALPDFDRDEQLNLRTNYFAQTHWFFGILLALLLVSLLRGAIVTLTLQGSGFSLADISVGADLIFHIAFITFVAVGGVWKNELYHKTLAVLSVLTFALYVATLFTELR